MIKQATDTFEPAKYLDAYNNYMPKDITVDDRGNPVAVSND